MAEPEIAVSVVHSCSWHWRRSWQAIVFQPLAKISAQSGCPSRATISTRGAEFFLADLNRCSPLFLIDCHVQEFQMKATKLTAAATTVACLALLAACGGGSAATDAAGTLMEAKQSTVEVKNATTEEAPTAEDQAAAAEAANVAAEGDAASAAKANGKGGKLANGRFAGGPGTCLLDDNGNWVCT
jgi:hypothetical protein